MPNVLQAILEDTRQAVDSRKKAGLPETVKKDDNRSFLNAIMHAQKPAIIAEIKAKSPSHGNFSSKLSIEERAKLYLHAGADAISYVSNFSYFGGLPKTVKDIKKVVKLPVLLKDFVIDEFQIREAAAYGADGLLLIARIVTREELQKLIVQCYAYNIEPVVELYDEEDFRKIEGFEVEIVGVNSRNLDTLVTDIDKACTIISKVAREYTTIGFSGISSKQDVSKYTQAGAQGVLIGAGVMKSDSVMYFIDSLR